MDLLQVRNFLRKPKSDLLPPVVTRLLIFSVTMVMLLESFQGHCRAGEMAMGLGQAILPQILLFLIKFSRCSQICLFVSILLLISRVLKVLTLTICCQCLCCFYEEAHVYSPSQCHSGNPTPPFLYFSPVKFNIFFITKKTAFPNWVS